jgi:hypothetical protein
VGDEKADIGAPSDRGVSISGWAGNSDEAFRCQLLIVRIALVVT